MAKEISYEVKKEIGTIKEDEKYPMLLRVVSWNGRDAKIDIRNYTIEEEKEKPGKGICLSNDEAKVLVDLLNEYLNDSGEDDDF